jgi:glycine dehydrogenase subunit 1
MMCSLTGLDVTNASMYDGATSLAESAMMGVRINGRNRVLVSRGVHPNYRRVLETYAWASGFTVEEIPLSGGLTDAVAVRRLFDERVSSVILQSPNFTGAIEDIKSFSAITSGGPALLVTAVAEAMSMGILKGPGESGADVVCGEVQSFGNPLNFGGPYAGYISARSGFMRKMPGRLAGRTVDASGNTVYALTLQTREQHIRREKATSNICTNEGLVALRAAVYLSLIGVKLRDIAQLNHNTAAYLRRNLEEEGMEIVHPANPFFNEFIIRPASVDRFMFEFHRRGINPGLDMGLFIPEYSGCILVCASELSSRDDCDEYVNIVKEAEL